MEPIRRILVAVKNPDLRAQPGVDKAIHIAKQLGASLELFDAISTPVFLDIEPLSGRSLTEIKRQSLELRRARLERMVEKARKRGVKASSHVAWDFPPQEAIVRRAEQLHADLIIAECHKGKRLKPWLMHLTDWELLRLSPRPVLLLKNARVWRNPLVLAAVDPSHAHAKPAMLDDTIVAHAAQLGKALKGSFELVHANFPAAFGVLMADPMLDSPTLASAFEQQKLHSRIEFERFARKAKIPKASCHLLDTDPEFAIPHVARQIGADLVVMGAVSRTGLKRVFIGNTAERILAALSCDVLVIKPRHFARRVARRARGMRVVPPQAMLPLPA